MKLFFLLTLVSLFLLIFPPPTHADLENDKQALLQFAASFPHGRKVNWTSSSPVCTAWVGITCSSDNNSVVAVRLPGVGLKGVVPSNTLGKLDHLTTLSLKSNLLSRSLPSDLLSLPFLQYVYLQQNNLSGKTLSSLLPQLNSLDLASNSLEGEIPSSVQNLTNLNKLFLQNNALTGSIPKLNNQSLKHLNLSNNHLNGSIPLALSGFPDSSFQGNTGLCGPPLKQCYGVSPAPAPAPVVSPSANVGPTPAAQEKVHSKKSKMAIPM